MSEWAGGYKEQLAEKILEGAEKFLGGRRATLNFPVEGQGPADSGFVCTECAAPAKPLQASVRTRPLGSNKVVC